MSTDGLSQSLIWPVAFGYFVISAVLSVTAIQMGLEGWVYPLMSLWVYAGSSQIAMLAMAASGQGLWLMLATVLALNIRHFFMGLSLAPHLQHLTRSKRLLWSFQLTDEVFAMLINALRQRKQAFSIAQLFNVSMPCHMGWFLGAWVGWFSLDFADFLAQYAFEFSATAMLLYILALLLKQREDWVIAGVSIGVTLILLQWGFERSGFLVGALVAASLGALCFKIDEKKNVIQ